MSFPEKPRWQPGIKTEKREQRKKERKKEEEEESVKC